MVSRFVEDRHDDGDEGIVRNDLHSRFDISSRVLLLETPSRLDDRIESSLNFGFQPNSSRDFFTRCNETRRVSQAFAELLRR